MADTNNNITEEEKTKAKAALIADGNRTDGSGVAMVHGVESVGRIQFLLKHPMLNTLATANSDAYGAIKDGVALTGFKLDDVTIKTETLIDNAKLVPMLNGDTMTLTNSNKSGTISIACTRTAAGIAGGDLVAIADFIRSQGDCTGGTLVVSWLRNGAQKKIEFKSVCVKKCAPLQYAGNDLPSYDVQLTYATYADGDYPTWN